MNFKVGDRVKCIKRPDSEHYQCKLGEKGTITRVGELKPLIQFDPSLFGENVTGAWYSSDLFELVEDIPIPILILHTRKETYWKQLQESYYLRTNRL